jgi:hypothetical protein
VRVTERAIMCEWESLEAEEEEAEEDGGEIHLASWVLGRR